MKEGKRVREREGERSKRICLLKVSSLVKDEKEIENTKKTMREKLWKKNMKNKSSTEGRRMVIREKILKEKNDWEEEEKSVSWDIIVQIRRWNVYTTQLRRGGREGFS